VTAGSLWTASAIGVKFVYLIRPDGMLAAWLTGAWACATVLMVRDERRSSWLAGGFWLCVAGAALSKGPVAAIALIYAVLAARLIAGHWRDVNRVQWWWGGPLMLLLVGGGRGWPIRWAFGWACSVTTSITARWTAAPGSC
jgi:4-amino-4-deoxy-L-arabinose transferase-like glycosyltransferase